MKIKKIVIISLTVLLFFAGLLGLVIYKNLFSGKTYLVNKILKNYSIHVVDDDYLEDYHHPSQFKTDVLRYKINIELLPAEKEIVADTEIKLVRKNNTDKLYLNFDDEFDISEVKVNGKPVNYENDDLHIIISTGNIKDDTLFVTFSYSGKPDGGIYFDENDSIPAVYSINEPVLASHWFPCNDLLTDKAFLDILITADSSLDAVSNGILTSISFKGNKKITSWKTKYPISTYLVALYVSDYEHFGETVKTVNGDSVQLIYYVFPEDLIDAEKDFSVNKEILKTFTSLFGEYPFIKEKYGIVEFTWQYGAMENQTVTGFSNKFISGNRFYTDVLAHEMAHHWWGNAVTPETWKDVWLNEGFSTYSEALYYEKRSGRDALISTLESKFDFFDDTELYDPEEKMFSRTIYDKGAWVLHMLRYETGDSLFFASLRNYYERFKYKNASTKDFISVVEETSGKDLSRFFNQWVFEGKGIMKLSYDYKISETDSNITTEIYLEQGQSLYRNYHFPLDIKVTGNSALNSKFHFYITSRDTVLNIYTGFYPAEIKLDPERWLLADIIQNEKLIR